MNLRRSSGGSVPIELQVAIQRLRPFVTASTTFNAARRRSPDAPTSAFCIAPRSKAIVGILAVFPVALADALDRASRPNLEIAPTGSELVAAQAS